MTRERRPLVAGSVMRARLLQGLADDITGRCHDPEALDVANDQFAGFQHSPWFIIDLCFILMSQTDHLGPLRQRQWDSLRKIVRRV